jgi:hypothetical protein
VSVSHSKKPSKISKELWQQITSVKKLDEYSGKNTPTVVPAFSSRKGSNNSSGFEATAAKIFVDI